MLTQKQIEMNKSRNKYVKFCLEATKISNPNNNPEQTTMPITPTNKNKRKNRNKKNKNLNNSTNESSSKEEELNTPRPFQPFDYSQVDYSNYKGGSNTTPKGRSGPKERFRKVNKINKITFFFLINLIFNYLFHFHFFILGQKKIYRYRK